MNQALARTPNPVSQGSELSRPSRHPLRTAFIVTGLVATLVQFVGLAVALSRTT